MQQQKKKTNIQNSLLVIFLCVKKRFGNTKFDLKSYSYFRSLIKRVWVILTCMAHVKQSKNRNIPIIFMHLIN